MIEGVKYVKYEGNEELVEVYYDSLFFLHETKVINVLQAYCKLEATAVNEELRCYFSVQFPDKNDEEYFGESGVAFYLDYPAVEEDDDCIVVLTYDEFLKVVKKRYGDYIKKHPGKRNKILPLLDSLEKTLSH